MSSMSCLLEAAAARTMASKAPLRSSAETTPGIEINAGARDAPLDSFWISTYAFKGSSLP